MRLTWLICVFVVLCVLFVGCQKQQVVRDNESLSEMEAQSATTKSPPAPQPESKPKPILGKEPLVGKTMDQILAIFGEPTKTIKGIFGLEWHYGRGATVWPSGSQKARWLVITFTSLGDSYRVKTVQYDMGFVDPFVGATDIASDIAIEDAIHANLLNRPPTCKRIIPNSLPRRFIVVWDTNEASIRLYGQAPSSPYSIETKLNRTTGLRESTYRWTLSEWRKCEFRGYREYRKGLYGGGENTIGIVEIK